MIISQNQNPKFSIKPFPMASICRRLSISLLRSPAKSLSPSPTLSRRFCAASESAAEPEPDYNSEPDAATSDPPERPPIFDRPLENGLDAGIYKAILVGQAGQTPIQKKLRSGKVVTLLSIGTGGIRNNRRPFDNEEPREYANRSAVQWHRVSIYPERLGLIALKHVVPGSILYMEGNLETKIFTDPITGLVRRIREVAIRRNGRLVFLGNGEVADKPVQADLKGVGYY